MKQEIQIQNLKDNPELLRLKLGQAIVQTSTHDFIYYYDLQPIAQEIASIETRLNYDQEQQKYPISN